MFQVTLTIQLTLVGPILSEGTSPGTIGIDSPMARDSEGRYYLPYSLVRGRLKQAWEELREATNGEYDPPVSRMLGVRSGDAYEEYEGSFEPARGILSFTDFRHDLQLGDRQGIIYRLRIDSERGAAKKGALQVMECPFPTAMEVIFSGTVSYIAQNSQEENDISSYIENGLKWITSLGGERSVGFGRLVKVDIEKKSRPLQISPTTAKGVKVLDIAITPQAPFCVAKRRVIHNLFESDDVISGAVLRGALASTLKRLAGLAGDAEINERITQPWKELGENFNRIRFSHAFPAMEEAVHRPVVPPLSLVQNNNTQKKIYDVALCNGPVLLGDPPNAPSFDIDWKDSDGTRNHVLHDFGWGFPKRELRVRTAIERTSRRAKEKNLFAYEMVVPRGYKWFASIDLNQVPDGARTAVETQLRAILSYGLHGIGKTKASALVEIKSEMAPVYPSTHSPIDGLWVVTIQTPVLLCDPKMLDERSEEAELLEAYAAAWSDISRETLKLERFFTSQSLAGGYLVRRFQSGKPYNPFLLTDPGSVFVLRTSANADESDVRSCVREWNGRLPLPSWAKDRYGNDWRSCPFLPDDGFGEIAVNLPCHKEKLPPEEVTHAIHEPLAN